MAGQSVYNSPDVAPAHVNVGGTSIWGFSTADGVTNFLGIPYGKIPSRFRRSQLVHLETLGPDVVDATAYGPSCPQPPTWTLDRNSRAYLYEGAQPSADPVASELDCLRLNIYTPAESTSADASKLPVLVWIHGGGFIGGDGSWQYDGNGLVQRSISQGKPSVIVSINYRLGYLGFLSSKELRAEAEDDGEEYVPNQGLYDQRLALQWVQKYIHHFGGDGSNVTVAGQSAGAWAAHAHVAAKERLCSSGLIMSAMAFSQNTPEEAQAVFDRLVESIGVPASAAGAEKLAALRALTEDQVADLLHGAMIVKPTWDTTWFYGQELPVRIEHITKFPDWIRGLVVGSTKDESSFLYGLWESYSVEKLCRLADSAVKAGSTPLKLGDAYGILPSEPHDQVLEGAIDFTTDAFFRLFSSVLRHAELPVSVYRFDQVDSLATGSARDFAYHSLDTPHLFRLPAVTGPGGAPESTAATSDALSDAVIEFLHGVQPWVPVRDSGKFMVFKGRESGLARVADKERWESCVSTAEEEDSFAAAGLAFFITKP